MPFQPSQGAPPPAAPPPAFPPAGPPVHQTTLPPPGASPWAAPAQAGRPTLTAGTLLTRSLQVWWRNLGKLVAMSLVMLAPIAVLGVAMAGAGVLGDGGARAEPTALVVVLVGLLVLVLLPLVMIMLGGVNYGVIRWLAGQPAGVGDMLSQGARRIWGILLAALLVGLATMGGYVLLIVPGIMIAVATCVALPAVTVERIGAVEAFRRSLALTRGYRWSIFGAFVALFAINLLVSIVGALLQIIPILGILMSLALSLVTATMPYVMPAVAYHDLRVAKEGVDTSQLAKVFE